MCNQLLVPEASEDIWKQGGFLSSGHSMLGEDEHDAPEQQSYLEATIMKFMPERLIVESFGKLSSLFVLG
ncbi:uncharacterized protein LOC143241819 isoform X4 [Tachypleus tridentatus]|uniref:uncharacterized protein LOC143241819 isoform X4 n=1 Tax=Tachypleus tridentatus TaxID=6853 RepID=UPI003FD099C6